MYRAPVKSLKALMSHSAGLGDVQATETFSDASDEIIGDILEGAAKFAEDILAPTNRAGDLTPAKFSDGEVTTSPGFKDAYEAWVEAGWGAMTGPVEYGGMGMPQTLNVAVGEMMYAANMAFGLAPMLTHSAIEALHAHGSDELKDRYLPKLMTGEWSGTMNLTEPHSGSDLGTLRTKAEPLDDGTYALSGQKIYITWGEHDCAENIIHLVLARLPDAPEGSRGISLFLAPKYIPEADGTPGKRNSLKAIGLEHKMGIHGSPTCVMEFDNAKAWLVGEPNRGLAHMFTMMNSARLYVGVQGVAIAERAYQQALAYAQDRQQGRAPNWSGEGSSAIIDHPDVRRMLMEMKVRIAAARAICLATGQAADMFHATGDTSAATREALLTPIAKAWSTDMGVKVTSMGIQVHGGMGFIEETGAAQHFRDARIAPIYEGTNGIQAIDLVGRKLQRDGGQGMNELLHDLAAISSKADASLQPSLDRSRQILEAATSWFVSSGAEPVDTLSGATAYLELAGDVIGGHFLAEAAANMAAAGDPDADSQFAIAKAYSDFVLTRLSEDISHITAGHDTVFALSSEALADL